MNRRDSLKALAVGTVSVGTLLSSCDKKGGTDSAATGETGAYGRTPEEKLLDKKLMSEQFFTKPEIASIAILGDIIIPKDDISGSASDAEVAEFIEFIVKDKPELQLPMRGGLKWLDIKSYKMFKKSFAEASAEQRIQLVDLIAYPDKALPENAAGVSFFNTMRGLTATGFFTSKIGIADLGYKGNQPNAWDGVPDDVLKQFGLEYDAKTLDQCLKAEDRGKIMTWDS
ncbi:MAG: gluconate 2-dehydrogenase subunit 3 family protein [Daejeonella sp.]|uniref:gluconate 2-dehydrogenase subunit 3 family protein n=1 Tax=Daejeonella sp. TaxID=2805397 RepID=UPI003C74F683